MFTANKTAFYMFRMMFLTFHGKPKIPDIIEDIHAMQGRDGEANFDDLRVIEELTHLIEEGCTFVDFIS